MTNPLIHICRKYFLSCILRHLNFKAVRKKRCVRLLHTLVQQYFARYHLSKLLGELLVFLKPLQPCFCLFYGEIVHLGVFLRLVAVFDVRQHVIQGYARACEYRLSAQDSLVLDDVYFLMHDFRIAQKIDYAT